MACAELVGIEDDELLSVLMYQRRQSVSEHLFGGEVDTLEAVLLHQGVELLSIVLVALVGGDEHALYLTAFIFDVLEQGLSCLLVGGVELEDIWVACGIAHFRCERNEERYMILESEGIRLNFKRY